MSRIKLTKTPNFEERLIDIKGQTISDLHLQGSFALNMKQNEPFITFDSTEDAWFLDLSLAVPDNDSLPWVQVPLSQLPLAAYDSNYNYLYTTYPFSDPIPSYNYFNGMPAYFKYKVIGSTVHFQYRLFINIPTAPVELPGDDENQISRPPIVWNTAYLELDLGLISQSIFTPVDDWTSNYFMNTSLPTSTYRMSDGLQMCWSTGSKMRFVNNTHLNGHHGLPIDFNFNLATNEHYVPAFKIVVTGTHTFEKVM
jgi:hypothetical protein